MESGKCRLAVEWVRLWSGNEVKWQYADRIAVGQHLTAYIDTTIIFQEVFGTHLSEYLLAAKNVYFGGFLCLVLIL